jgi:hypothetical protein
MRRIQEETYVKFEKYTDLSYLDEGYDDIVLYVNDKPIGKIKVWKDSEQEDREYVCVNYEIVYLDTLDKIN